MGQSVKVITKRADSPYVHELGLVAAELEQRYKDSKVGLQYPMHMQQKQPYDSNS